MPQKPDTPPPSPEPLQLHRLPRPHASPLGPALSELRDVAASAAYMLDFYVKGKVPPPYVNPPETLAKLRRALTRFCKHCP